MPQDAPYQVGDIVVFKLDGRDIPIVHRVLKVHAKYVTTAIASRVTPARATLDALTIDGLGGRPQGRWELGLAYQGR